MTARPCISACLLMMMDTRRLGVHQQANRQLLYDTVLARTNMFVQSIHVNAAGYGTIALQNALVSCMIAAVTASNDTCLCRQ